MSGADAAASGPRTERIHRHAPPGEDAEALRRESLVEDAARRRAGGRVGRQEDGADGESRGVGHGHAGVGRQGGHHPGRDGDGQARPVARLRVGGDRAPVGQRRQGLERQRHDARRPPRARAGLGDEPDAAGVVLEPGVVEGRAGDGRDGGDGAARSVHLGGLRGVAGPLPHRGRPTVRPRRVTISAVPARIGADPVPRGLPLRTDRPGRARATPALSGAAVRSAPVTAPRPVRLRVLVAAPLPADVGAVAAVLGAAGHEVLTAYRLDVVVARLVTDRPDVLVVDPAIGDASPADLVSRIGGYSDAPLLVLADVVDEAVVVAALDAGAVDVVGRPLRPLELLARIAAAVRRGGAGAARTGGPPRRPARGRRPAPRHRRGPRPRPDPDRARPPRRHGRPPRRRRRPPPPAPGCLARPGRRRPRDASNAPRPPQRQARRGGPPRACGTCGRGATPSAWRAQPRKGDAARVVEPGLAVAQACP